MQLINGPEDKQFPAIVNAMQSERIERYMSAAGRDQAVAFKFYLWNCAMGEAFFVPLHFSEIVCRNGIHRALLARAGDRWFEDRTLRSLLGDRFRDDLKKAVSEECAKHKDRTTANHIVSALTFGFWEHLTTKRFERFLWAKGIGVSFPNAPSGTTREDAHNLIESVRRWRNRIAHHEAIFDKKPMRKHQDTIELVKWVCGDTVAWVQAISRVPVVISARPK